MTRIGILPPETARLIAAGEVIDRPASALRELLDNSIDAEASEILVRIESGGIESILIVDDGIGMSKEDLELSILEHATSKIRSADDLLLARTLGFRGEALASIAAVSRLEITSRDAESESGWKLTSAPGEPFKLEAVPARRGTSVASDGIFERYPARKQFLKRPSSEAQLCRQNFVEKALAHPGIRFRWDSGSAVEILPASSQTERLLSLYPEISAPLISTLSIEEENFSVTVLYADPSIHRRDRKLTQVFVNRRKVPEWGLSSVLDFAFSRYIPGGMHPCAFCFARIDPALADFNIHPAKREVRIKNIETIKSVLYARLKEALESDFGKAGGSGFSIAYPAETPATQAAQGNGGLFLETPTYPQKTADIEDFLSSRGSFYRGASGPGERMPSPDFWDKVKSGALGSDAARPPPVAYLGGGERGAFRYLGRAFGPFLVFELQERLYILDQHAAHERILFDRLLANGPSPSPLLVPHILDDLSKEQSALIEKSLPQLAEIGYAIEKEGSSWIIESIPGILGDDAIPALMEWIDAGIDETAGKNLLATMACRAAVKDGEALDDVAAIELIRMSLDLPFPRCPHGRPIWVVLDRNYLYKMVGRLPD